MTQKGLTKKQFRDVLVLLNEESRVQKMMGNIVAIILVVGSPILFISILWMLARLK